MQAHRGKLLAAILTIARGWIDAGQPAEDVRSDDYAEWVKGLRGLMGWAQFPGTFGGSSSEVALSSDDEEWHDFLEALHDVFGLLPFTTKTLVDNIGTVAPYSHPADKLDAAVLPGDLSDKWSRISHMGSDAHFRRSLGAWLRNREGRYAAGWSLVYAGRDTHYKVPQYVVRPPASGP